MEFHTVWKNLKNIACFRKKKLRLKRNNIILEQCQETAADFQVAYGGLWLFVFWLTAESQN